ncbi:MAG TPA: GNAT family N-acetyltransferase, partial [Acetobacteraceae bacterium]|nr:GNAT family N-acetyltransferase [Acetobacteraceae bacterium]
AGSEPGHDERGPGCRPEVPMISVRRARPADAISIGSVHVAAWRSAYPGILPDDFLARLSVPRQAAHYDAAIRSSSTGVFVASASGNDVPPGSGSRIMGFATAGRARTKLAGGGVLAEGEVETLYVLDDWRDRGVGRKLMRAAAAWLAEAGCKSCFVWVLRDNPSRWFYQRLGGKPTAEAVIQFAGQKVPQTAFVWDPIERLLAASPQES